MSLLVLHAGAENCDGGLVQQELAAWSEPLRAAGVYVPAAREPKEWREIALALVRGLESPAVEALYGALADDCTVAVVSSDALCDALHPPRKAESFAGLAAERDVEVRVVAIVREQIGFINTLYTRRLLKLDTARSFDEFVADPVPPHRFDWAASYGSIADTDGLDLVALPYPQVTQAGPTRSLLRTAGLDDAVVDALPDTGLTPDTTPGPVLVAATRLLHKRLRRNRMFDLRSRDELREIARRLRAQAEERGWDSAPYWGWSEEMAHETAEEYRPSNDMFADFVWGHPFEEPFSESAQQVADIAGLEPARLRDVVDTVDSIVREAVERSSAPPDSAQRHSTEPDSSEGAGVAADTVRTD